MRETDNNSQLLNFLSRSGGIPSSEEGVGSFNGASGFKRCREDDAIDRTACNLPDEESTRTNLNPPRFKSIFKRPVELSERLKLMDEGRQGEEAKSKSHNSSSFRNERSHRRSLSVFSAFVRSETEVPKS